MAELNFPTGVVDGTTFIYDDKICVYRQDTSTWECQTNFGPPIEPETDDSIYTTNVYVPEPFRENAQTFLDIDNPTEALNTIQTQYDVNQLNIDYSKRALLDARRTQDNIDFLQETISAGLWIRTTGEQAASVPGPTEFFVLNSSGQPVYNFADAERFMFAGEGTGVLNQNPTLQNTKVGDYLIIQDNRDNEFGIYVVDEIQVIGQPGQGGLWFIQMEVRVVNNKAFGSVNDSDHCTVRTTRPVFLLPAATAPVVSAEGYIWFKNDTHELYVSTRGDTDPEEPGVDQWVKIGPGSETYITSQYLEQRLAAIQTNQLPSNLITDSELEVRLAQINIPTIPSNLATTTYVENRISAIPPHTGPTQQDFTILTQTLTAGLNQVVANVESKATQQDVSLAVTAVDAKFDMLRSAIAEATDFDTLKARLLAVLQ